MGRGVPPPEPQLFFDTFWHAFLGKVYFWPEKSAPARQRHPVATGLGNPSHCQGPGGPIGDPKGVRAGPGTPILVPKTSNMVRNGSSWLRLGRYLHCIDPTGSAEPL